MCSYNMLKFNPFTKSSCKVRKTDYMQFDITEEVACIYGECSLFFEMTKNRCVFNVCILDCKVFKLKYYCIISY